MKKVIRNILALMGILKINKVEMKPVPKPHYRMTIVPLRGSFQNNIDHVTSWVDEFWSVPFFEESLIFQCDGKSDPSDHYVVGFEVSR